MGKKRRIGQLEAAAPPQPAEPKPQTIAISADDAGEAKPAEVPVAKGEVKSEEAKTEEVMHKRKKREEELEMQSTVIEQCGDGDVEKIEPPKKKRRKKKKNKKKSEVSELQNAVAKGVADDAVAREKNKKRKKVKLFNCLDVCVICREKGHVISTCPLLSQTEDSNKKSGNMLPDCPQPLQDVDLKNGKAEKLLGCPLVETLKKNYGAKEDESIVKNGEESSCTPVDVFLKDQKSDGRGDDAIVSVDSGSHPEKGLCETND